MILLWILVCLSSINSQSTPSIDCGWLRDSFQFMNSDEFNQSYNGECCNSESVDFMDSYNKTKKWRTVSVSNRAAYINYLIRNKKCADFTTTTIPPTTTTTEDLNCAWLDKPFIYTFFLTSMYYDGKCCNQEAIEELNSMRNGDEWRLTTDLSDKYLYVKTLRGKNLCSESTTPSSTTPATTVPPTTISSSTRSLSPTKPTTISNSNCYWLKTPFNYSGVYNNGNPFDFSYNGACCSEIAVRALLDIGEWALNPDQWNRWSFLSNFLYCVDGACTDPPLWNNCSMSTTSSSSSTSAQTTTSSKRTTSSGQTTDSTTTSNDGETSVTTATPSSTSTFPTTAATKASENGNNNDETTTMPMTITGSTSETKTTTDVDSSSTTTSTQLSTEGTKETGSTGTETTTPTTTTATSGGSTATGETTTSTTSTTSTPTTGTTGDIVTTSEGSTSASTSTMSTTPTASHTSFTYGSTDTTESTMATQTSSIKTVTEGSTAPTPPTTESMSPASTISGQTTQSTPTTEVTGTTTTSTGTSGASTTSGTTGITIGNQTSTPTSTTTSGTTTNTDGVYVSCPISSSTTPMTTPEQTTTYNWPTGGTTRILLSGEIILSESLIAYPNCTTVLKQLIFNPSTNESRTETTTDEYGCRTSTTPLKTSTTPMTTPGTTPTQSNTAKTTTYNWPTGGTTKILPSGEIILSESLIAYPNCTTVLMQLIFNPSTNESRTETTTDEYGCRTSTTPLKTSTTPMTTPGTTPTQSNTAKTTTYNWPTGGTTKILPSGEIILSESLIAYPNCTTVLMQLIFNPSTNATRTETTTDEYGCKPTSPTVAQSVKTTTYNWPTGGTTKTLPSGEIILSESLIAYTNCTTVLMQLIYNPRTNTTRTETTSDAEGCKATSSSVYITTPMSGGATTPSPSDATTTFQWPTGGTTRMLPSGEIIISESLIAYKNCTTILMQLIFNPSTNTTRTETTTDANGCKSTSTGARSGSPGVTSSMATPTTTETPFTFPDSKTTQILPNGEIILSESLIAYPNCTTVLKQLIFNPATNTTRTKTSSDAQGCKATSTTKPSATTRIAIAFSTPIPPTTTTKSFTTTPVASNTASPVTTTTPPPTTTTSPRRSTRAVPVTCPFPSNLNLINTNRPTPEEIKENYAVGERIIHICKKYYIQELSKQPLRIYQCGEDGKWIGTLQKCVLEPGRTEL
ncbi:hypothetical protein CRE_07706 [Caenorhabditis remanei]|uniref:Sushi domain-containing protein n=1 Tax=Caenorhabditis remanei TaxID=31234 RepID=E3MZR9_CAERE|nr:hypothetical protein CRE_07706 [Caenorhabditis remanei]